MASYLEKFNSDLLKKQQSCDIFSRMNSFESDTFVNTPKNNSPKSYSEITKSPDESQKLNNSASPVERDAFSTDCANELKSDNDINFQNFQTDIRTLILPKQSPGAFYSDYFRMAVSYFLDLFKSKLERDVRHLKTEFDSPIPAPFPDYSLRNEAFPLTFSDPMLAHLPSPCYNNIFSSHQQSYFFPTDPLYYYPNPPMGGYYF